jgi:hypothetical protein
MSAASDLDFLRKIQRLLSEGEFVATYKFALLQALADLSMERALIQASLCADSIPVLFTWPGAVRWNGDACYGALSR